MSDAGDRTEVVDLDGRAVVLTGAGGGLGRAYARLLARRGAHVVVHDTGVAADGSGGDPAVAESVAQEIVGAGGEAVALSGPVTTPAAAEALVEAAVDRYGRLDALVHAAGVVAGGTVAKVDPVAVEAAIDAHLRTPLLLARAAMPRMKAQRYGRIVLSTSSASLFGAYGQAVEVATAGAAVALVRALALEGGRWDTRANAVSPLARTRQTEHVLGGFESGLEPEQVAPLVAYLASEACEPSGAVFACGGGRFGRISTTVTPGWYAPPGAPASPEEVAAHLPEILSEEGATTPYDVADDRFLTVMRHLGNPPEPADAG